MKNRVIKFRAWDYSHNCFLPTDTFVITDGRFSELGMMCKDWENYREGEYLFDHSQCVTQYTGLKDKNGVEIYEGDIVKYSGGSWDFLGVVEFGTVSFGFDDWGIEQIYTCWHMEYSDKSGYIKIDSNCEVIGNVFSNPEILK